VGMRSPTCRRELEQALGDYPGVRFVRAQAAGDCFAITSDADPVRNHDDLTFYLRRGKMLHPCEFVHD
jgi:hypothetical protein